MLVFEILPNYSFSLPAKSFCKIHQCPYKQRNVFFQNHHISCKQKRKNKDYDDDAKRPNGPRRWPIVHDTYLLSQSRRQLLLVDDQFFLHLFDDFREFRTCVILLDMYHITWTRTISFFAIVMGLFTRGSCCVIIRALRAVDVDPCDVFVKSERTGFTFLTCTIDLIPFAARHDTGLGSHWDCGRLSLTMQTIPP